MGQSPWEASSYSVFRIVVVVVIIIIIAVQLRVKITFITTVKMARNISLDKSSQSTFTKAVKNIKRLIKASICQWKWERKVMTDFIFEFLFKVCGTCVIYAFIIGLACICGLFDYYNLFCVILTL
jgi:hypothetical protein